jgi:hypothetical protein
MSGLRRMCKLYGAIEIRREGAGPVRYVWDYVAGEAVHESEMPEGGERWQASERAKWTALRDANDASAR